MFFLFALALALALALAFSCTGSSCINPGKWVVVSNLHSFELVVMLLGLLMFRYQPDCYVSRYQPDERRWWMTLVNDPTVWAVSNASMKSLIMGGWQTLMLSSIQEEC